MLAGVSTDQSIYLWEVTPPQTTPAPATGVGATIHHAADARSTLARKLAILHELVAGNRVIAFRPYQEGVMPLPPAAGTMAIRLWDLTPLFRATQGPAGAPDQPWPRRRGAR
ncbi:MAG: hypothetical protein R3E79_56340 [Caldilineaceae bacterium]